MPYESTIYGQMNEEMLERFKASFASSIRKAAEEFRPDLVICHHLYLVTSIAREVLPECRVCGFCHNTDLRQMKKDSTGTGIYPNTDSETGCGLCTA